MLGSLLVTNACAFDCYADTLFACQDMLPWDDDIDVGIQWFYMFVLQWISEVYKNDTYVLEINPHFVLGQYVRSGLHFSTVQSFRCLPSFVLFPRFISLFFLVCFAY